MTKDSHVEVGPIDLRSTSRPLEPSTDWAKWMFYSPALAAVLFFLGLLATVFVPPLAFVLFGGAASVLIAAGCFFVNVLIIEPLKPAKPVAPEIRQEYRRKALEYEVLRFQTMENGLRYLSRTGRSSLPTDYQHESGLWADFPNRSDYDWLRGRMADREFKLYLANSPKTHPDELGRLSRDQDGEIRAAADLMYTVSPMVRRIREIELAERNAAEQRRNAELQAEAQKRAAERKRSEEADERRRLGVARSTDTERWVLRRIASDDPSPLVKRAAIETLALLNQAGV